MFRILSRSSNSESRNLIDAFFIRGLKTSSASVRSAEDTIYSRIIPLMRPNSSKKLVPVLNKWISDGKRAREMDLHGIIRELRNRKLYPQALEISEWMSRKSDCRFREGDYAAQLNLIGIVRGLESAENYFNSLGEEFKKERAYGALLSCYVRYGLVDKSLSLLQKMKDMGFASTPQLFNNIMSLYSKNDQFEKIPDVLSEMKQNGVSLDNFSYRITIHSYGVRSDFENMEKLIEEMESQPGIVMDWTTYSTIANIYLKADNKDKALIYMKKMEERVGADDDGYNHLISFYSILGDKEGMIRVWELQKAACKKHINRDYRTMLSCLVKIEDFEKAEEIVREWLLSVHRIDFRVLNPVLIGYCNKGMMEKAEALVYEIMKKGLIPVPNCWSILCSGYMEKGNMKKALESMNKALAVAPQNRSWRPKQEVVGGILRWLGEERAVEEVEGLEKGLRVVGTLDKWAYEGLIEAYRKCGKEEKVEALYAEEKESAEVETCGEMEEEEEEEEEKIVEKSG